MSTPKSNRPLPSKQRNRHGIRLAPSPEDMVNCCSMHKTGYRDSAFCYSKIPSLTPSLSPMHPTPPLLSTLALNHFPKASQTTNLTPTYQLLLQASSRLIHSIHSHLTFSCKVFCIYVSDTCSSSCLIVISGSYRVGSREACVEPEFGR